MDLSELRPGQSGRVAMVREDRGRRLQDLGFVAGAVTKCLFRSPLREPTAFEICGVTVALRREDARRIALETVWD